MLETHLWGAIPPSMGMGYVMALSKARVVIISFGWRSMDLMMTQQSTAKY